MATNLLRLAALLAPLALLAACSEGNPGEPTVDRKPLLSLQQTAVRTVEVRIAGPHGLRALQARLSWDPAALRVAKLEPGRESKGLDRVFWNDPSKASGSLLFGLSDTRQVLLPARGALLLVQLLPLDASLADSQLRLEEAVGVEPGAKALSLEPVSAEVKLR